MTKKRNLTAKEARARIGIGESTFHKLIREGVIKQTRIRGMENNPRYDSDHIEAVANGLLVHNELELKVAALEEVLKAEREDWIESDNPDYVVKRKPMDLSHFNPLDHKPMKDRE